MKKRAAFWLAAVVMALTACGGGSDAQPEPEFAPTPAPEEMLPPPPQPEPERGPELAPDPEPTPATRDYPEPLPEDHALPRDVDRIEPLDTALLPSAETRFVKALALRDPVDVPRRRIELGPFQETKPETSGRKWGGPMKIGESREIAATAHPADVAAMLTWRSAPDGSLVAGIEFSSEGARAIRLAVQVDQVPAGTVLRFYDAGERVEWEVDSRQIAQQRHINESAGVSVDKARLVWGPITAGSVGALEVRLPPGAHPAQLQFAVPFLVHQYVDFSMYGSVVSLNSASKISIAQASGSSSTDPMCRADLQAESRSVAMMSFIHDDGQYTRCTGTLLNDAAGSQTPYLLTAAHCIASQDSAASLTTHWFYRSSGCDEPESVGGEHVILKGGAELLFVDRETDISLLRLNAQPPAGVVYAGSYFGEGVAFGLDVTGIHHPQGERQKYGEGRIVGYSQCELGGPRLSCLLPTDEVAAMLLVRLHKGLAQPGSSGSPLLVSLGPRRYLAGTLTGYVVDEEAKLGAQFTVYGRYDAAFAKGLYRWLLAGAASVTP